MGLYVWVTSNFARAMYLETASGWFRAWRTFFFYFWIHLAEVAVNMVIGIYLPEWQVELMVHGAALLMVIIGTVLMLPLKQLW